MVLRRFDNSEFGIETAVGKPAMKHGASHLAAANEGNERFHPVTGRGAGGATPPLVTIITAVAASPAFSAPVTT